MHISTALKLSDSLSVKSKRGEALTDLEWAVRVLAGAYRRQKAISESLKTPGLHDQAKDIIKQLKTALKQFGEYSFLDKGPREVMPLPGAEVGEILRQVADGHEYGKNLIDRLAENFEDMPEDWVGEMIRVSGAEF